MAAGLFVVFEGGEGAGKSTQAALLAATLRGHGRTVVATREPGGTPLAEQIRDLLLSPANAAMDPRCEALLFAAARAEHVAKVIRPAVASGEVVICDRFTDSSIAYQGAARGLSEAEVADLSRWATDGLCADLTVLLDVAADTGISRAQDRNRMEAEPATFHDRVRSGLLALANSSPQRYLVLDAARPIPELAAEIAVRVGTMLAGRP